MKILLNGSAVILEFVSCSPTKQPNLVRVKQYFVTLFKIWSNEKETIYRESKDIDHIRAREWQEHRRDMSVTPN